MEKDLEYWKKRCELAEKVIEQSLDNPNATNKQFDAYWEWKEFIKNTLVNDVDAPVSEEEKERALKYIDEIVLPSRIYEQDEVGEMLFHLEGLRLDDNGNFQQIIIPEEPSPEDLDKEATEFAEHLCRVIKKEEELTEEERNAIKIISNLTKEQCDFLNDFIENYTNKEDKPC